jgi:hypothetical protein
VTTSKDPRAEAIMGRRPEGRTAFDQPCELGYRCPACRAAHETDGNYDERLHWSEYNGFLWCETCDLDWPSALCVPLDTAPDDREWVNAGPAAAIDVYLATVKDAVTRATDTLTQARKLAGQFKAAPTYDATAILHQLIDLLTGDQP